MVKEVVYMESCVYRRDRQVGAAKKEDYTDWCVTGVVKQVVYRYRCVTGELACTISKRGNVHG